MEHLDFDQNRGRRAREPRDQALGPRDADPPSHWNRRPQAETEEAVHELAEAGFASECPGALEHAPWALLEVEEMCQPPHRQHPEHDPEPLAVWHERPRGQEDTAFSQAEPPVRPGCAMK